jgi:hypothetical protein
MISLPIQATSGGNAAATIVNAASATTPPGADCHTSPSARAECLALAAMRAASGGGAGGGGGAVITGWPFMRREA